MDTANTYYKESSPASVEWIVLELDCAYMYALGIPILSATAPENGNIQCLQIFGGISTLAPNLVTAMYPVLRDRADGTFLQLMAPVYPDCGCGPTTGGESNGGACEIKKKPKSASGEVEQPKEQATSTGRRFFPKLGRK